VSDRYLQISSALGAVDPARGLDLPAGVTRRYRAEHLAHLRATNGALDDACESGRIAVRRVALSGDEAERCDEAWRRASQPWRFAGDVRIPDGGGLGSSAVGR
jgi:hypothetical protein